MYFFKVKVFWGGFGVKLVNNSKGYLSHPFRCAEKAQALTISFNISKTSLDRSKGLFCALSGTAF
jgi:hypothetical protein